VDLRRASKQTKKLNLEEYLKKLFRDLLDIHDGNSNERRSTIEALEWLDTVTDGGDVECEISGGDHFSGRSGNETSSCNVRESLNLVNLVSIHEDNHVLLEGLILDLQ